MSPRTPRLDRRLAAAVLMLAALLAGCAHAPLPADTPAAATAAAPLPATASIAATPSPDTPPPAATEPAAGSEAAAPAMAAVRPRLDPAQDAARLDLWDRVRQGFVMQELDSELVRKWEQFYARDAAYTGRMIERGGRYLFHIVEEVQRRGLPMELALLPFIESAFNPQAMSRAAASGMWQFMPATGREFELRQNLFRDDRRAVLASTRAALDYLQRLHGLFGDWHLALAAYNWGQGNVSRAIERNRRAGMATDYESLRMPQETRDYVPKLQAVKNIIARPSDFGFTLAPLDNHPFFLTVPIERDIDVALAARLAGLTLAEFQQLNPQMNKPVILAAGTPELLLPYDSANRFVRELAAHRGPLASWTAWVAPRTLRPQEAARLAGTTESTLREANRIPARMMVRAGSTLLVPRAAHKTTDVSEHIADTAALLLAPEPRALRTMRVKAGRNDTVATIARRHKVSPAMVAQWNGVAPGARFAPGQPVVIKLAAPAPRRSVARASARPAAQPPRAQARAPAGGTRKPAAARLATR